MLDLLPRISIYVSTYLSFACLAVLSPRRHRPFDLGQAKWETQLRDRVVTIAAGAATSAVPLCVRFPKHAPDSSQVRFKLYLLDLQQA